MPENPDQQRLARPIGVFDSGLGGLTVVREMLRTLPGERIVYIGDTAHVPYGGRPLEQVHGFADEISRYLIEDIGCKALVMACNISSAVAFESVQTRFSEIPMLGVIGPGARAATGIARGGPIAVLATEGTVRSGAYARAIERESPGTAVTSVACPLFVPLVEAGESDSPAADEACREYLSRARGESDARVIVLGCTHYPFLLPALTRIAGAGVSFVDPAGETVRELACLLKREGLAAPVPPTDGRVDGRPLAHSGESEQFDSPTGLAEPAVFHVTGDPRAFSRSARAFLGNLTTIEARALHWDARTGRLNQHVEPAN